MAQPASHDLPGAISPDQPVAFFVERFRDGSEIEYSIRLDWEMVARLAHKAAFRNASHKTVVGPLTVRRTVVRRMPDKG